MRFCEGGGFFYLKNALFLFGLLNKKIYFCAAIYGFLGRNHITNSPRRRFITPSLSTIVGFWYGKLKKYAANICSFQKKRYLCTRNNRNGALVQLVRIRACHARGQGFESPTHRKKD